MGLWERECKYMPPGIRVGFEIDGEIFRRDGNPAVLRMRRTVARGLRERWPREKILEQTVVNGKFEGSADLTPGFEVINGKDNYFWTLTLWPDREQSAESHNATAKRPRSRPRRRRAA
ncbi:hypothetical protein [Bradyrhizobium sp. SZCCHNS2005]|uniref:hypothetical protein n=1 Tax=Bradyrhizobium sp. SZCCHNS2005 TaxID=3057303 RepID=UPI0028E5BF74|nr:hypothetical protein [Bradyrhizobium sp. SZCCHNS2005]